MNFLELANKRYSVRNYSETPIPREKIARCIEAVRLAPSACNSQPWKFIVADEAGLKTNVAKAAFEGLLDINHFAFKAPVLILIVSELLVCVQFGMFQLCFCRLLETQVLSL